jgi:hypothetical protein
LCLRENWISSPTGELAAPRSGADLPSLTTTESPRTRLICVDASPIRSYTECANRQFIDIACPDLALDSALTCRSGFAMDSQAVPWRSQTPGSYPDKATAGSMKQESCMALSSPVESLPELRASKQGNLAIVANTTLHSLFPPELRS